MATSACNALNTPLIKKKYTKTEKTNDKTPNKPMDVINLPTVSMSQLKVFNLL